MKILQLVSKYFRQYRRFIILFVFLNLILWIIRVINPLIIGKYIDSLTYLQENNVRIVYRIILILIFIWIVETVMSFFLNMITIKIQTKVILDFNYNMIEHIKRLPIKFFYNNNSAYLNQRISTDINTIVSFIFANTVQFFLQLVTLLITCCIVVRINRNIGMLLIFLVFPYIFTYFIFKNPLYRFGRLFKEKQNIVFAFINKQLDNISFIKLNPFFSYMGSKIKSKFDDLYSIIVKYNKIIFMFSTVNMIINRFSEVILFFYGGLQVIKGKLSIGEFIILKTYFSMLIGSTGYFLSISKLYQDSLVSYDRLLEILTMKEESVGVTKIIDVKNIEISNLSFSFDNEKEIFNNFSYNFEQGKIYCILGHNGSGKSTLINLIVGIYNNCYSGEILYNSINIRDIDMYDARENIIGVSEQEPILTDDTLKNNIIYGLNKINEVLLEQWCEKLDISKFIYSLPNGFNTNLEENSCNISGGEKQKISQARALIKEPKLIILDEPSSALDINGINNLCKVLKEIKQNKIIITHSIDMLNIADEVIDLSKKS